MYRFRLHGNSSCVSYHLLELTYGSTKHVELIYQFPPFGIQKLIRLCIEEQLELIQLTLSCIPLC